MLRHLRNSHLGILTLSLLIIFTIPAFAAKKAQKNEEPPKVEADREGEGNPPTGNTNAGQPELGGGAQAKGYWLPYCFLVDQGSDVAQVNRNIKRIVDEYARCDIAVEPFIRELDQNRPSDPNLLSTQTAELCDFDRAFDTRGAIQVMTTDAQIPITMCDNDPAVVGCSSLCRPISFSVVGPAGNDHVAVHESLHSNCCGPNCVDADSENSGRPAGFDLFLTFNGDVQKERKFWAIQGVSEGDTEVNAVAEQDSGTTLSGATCAALQAGATINDGVHRTQQRENTYWVPAQDPSLRITLNGQSLFPPKPGYPPPDNGGGEGGKKAEKNEKGEGPSKVALDESDVKKGNQRPIKPQNIEVKEAAAAPEILIPEINDVAHEKQLSDAGIILDNTKSDSSGTPAPTEQRYLTAAEVNNGGEVSGVSYDLNATKGETLSTGLPKKTTVAEQGSDGGFNANSSVSGIASPPKGTNFVDGVVGAIETFAGGSGWSNGFFGSVGTNPAKQEEELKDPYLYFKGQRGQSLRKPAGSFIVDQTKPTEGTY